MATTPGSPAGPERARARQARPAPQLRRHVTSYTGYRMAAAPPSTHQGVPSGHLTVVLCLDGKVEVLANADPARPPGAFTALVGGLHQAPAVLAQGAPQTGVQLRLTWRGSRALFGTPAGELAGDTVELDTLIGRRAGPLLDRLAEPGTWAERFARLDTELAALAARHDGGPGPAPEVGHAWDRSQETGGAVRVADLAREVGWSRRHLGECFRREIGLAPKAAARVIRRERACDRLRGPRPPALATLAVECGYVDQPHLAREFRGLAGLTATAWLAESAVVDH